MLNARRARARTQCSMDPLPYRQCIYNTRNTRKHVQPDDGDFYDYDSNLDVRCRLREPVAERALSFC
jgi:hypothetical protein